MKYFLTLLTLSFFNLYAFSTSNVQFLYGNFNDNSIFDTTSGGKSTLTLEHFREYKYGDFFAFTDIAIADKTFLNGESSDIYFELSPRVSFSKTMQRDFSSSFINDFFFAFQYNRQLVHNFEDYEAKLYGLGSSLNIKGFNVFDLNAYKKEQNFGNDTYQLSANYTSKNIYNTNITLDGFTDWTKEDFLTQNKLLYKLDYSLANATMFVGTEWHYYRVKDTNVKSNVLQAMLMLKW